MRANGGSPPTATAGAPPSKRLRVLVIDDEHNIRRTLSFCLQDMGCATAAAPGANSALEALRREPFDLAFLDLRLNDGDGLDLLPRLLRHQPDLAVVAISAFATEETAAEAIRRGARDFLPKPFTPAQIRMIVGPFVQRRASSGLPLS